MAKAAAKKAVKKGKFKIQYLHPTIRPKPDDHMSTLPMNLATTSWVCLQWQVFGLLRILFSKNVGIFSFENIFRLKIFIAAFLSE